MYLRVVKIKGSADILLERSFNLTAVVLCLFGCRALPTFWRPKSCKKPRHTEKIFASALCSRRKVRSIGRALARHSRLPLVFRVLRIALRTAILRKDNCRTAFERTSHNDLQTAGISVVILTLPVSL